MEGFAYKGLASWNFICDPLGMHARVLRQRVTEVRRVHTRLTLDRIAKYAIMQGLHEPGESLRSFKRPDWPVPRCLAPRCEVETSVPPLGGRQSPGRGESAFLSELAPRHRVRGRRCAVIEWPGEPRELPNADKCARRPSRRAVTARAVLAANLCPS